MYRKQVRLFNLQKINTLSMAIFIIVFIASSMINIFATDNIQQGYTVTGRVWLDVLIAVLLLVVGLFVHEGLHALTAICVGGNKKSDIKFGIKLKQGILYCHASKPMEKSKYLATLIVPVILTGIIPMIFSIIWANAVFIATFAFLIAGGAGDFVMFFDVLKNCEKEALIIDHENTVGYYKAYEDGKQPQDFMETTEEDEQKMLKDMHNQNVAFSQKTTWVKIVAIVLFVILIIVALYFIAKIIRLV